MLEILLAYTYTIIISAIVGLGNISSEGPEDVLPAVSERIPVESSESKVISILAEEMDTGGAELVGVSQGEPNGNLSSKSAKKESSSLASKADQIHDVFQEEGAAQDESNFESWAK